jgi:hypothetical protein
MAEQKPAEAKAEKQPYERTKIRTKNPEKGDTSRWTAGSRSA